MAEAVSPDRPSEPAVPEELPRFERPKAVHGGRFMIGYAVVVLMVGAVLVTLAVITRDDSSSSAAATQVAGIPVKENGFQRAREIATEIGRQYRAANGEQIVAVTAQPGEVSGLPLQFIALRHGRNRPLTEGDVSIVDPGETALFNFCGLGGEQNCSLPGQATPERLMLLRREAVELSLYTFKFLPEIETVVSLLPPVPRGEGQPPQTFAVYFQRRHLESLLGDPISKTLPESPPFAQGDLSPGEAETINRLTEERLFTSSFEQLQTQGVILNLSPPSA
ncbi:MAG TPA: hypothetical protein VIF36_00040 [Gaiellaceae bacterium]